MNEALRRHVDHDSRIAALDKFIRQYDAHGEITETEMNDAARRARGRAVVGQVWRGEPRQGRISYASCAAWTFGRSTNSSVDGPAFFSPPRVRPT